MNTIRSLRNGLTAGRLVLLLLATGFAQVTFAAVDQSAAPAQPPAWNEVAVQPGTYRQHQAAYKTETVDVPVRPGGGEIEYMVNMKQSDTIVYSWRALEIADAARLTSEFHGHTNRAPGTTGTLMFYRKATGASDNGSLVAPYDGTHGWYFKNDTPRPVVVRLTIAGFFEAIPDQIKK